MKITWDDKINEIKKHIKIYNENSSDLEKRIFMNEKILIFAAIEKDLLTLKKLYDSHTDSIGIEELLKSKPV